MQPCRILLRGPSPRKWSQVEHLLGSLPALVAPELKQAKEQELQGCEGLQGEGVLLGTGSPPVRLHAKQFLQCHAVLTCVCMCDDVGSLVPFSGSPWVGQRIVHSCMAAALLSDAAELCAAGHTWPRMPVTAIIAHIALYLSPAWYLGTAESARACLCNMV